MKCSWRESESPGCAEMRQPGKNNPQHCCDHPNPQQPGKLSDNADSPVQQEHSERAAPYCNEGAIIDEQTDLEFAQQRHNRGKHSFKVNMPKHRPDIGGVLPEA